MSRGGLTALLLVILMSCTSTSTTRQATPEERTVEETTSTTAAPARAPTTTADPAAAASLTQLERDWNELGERMDMAERGESFPNVRLCRAIDIAAESVAYALTLEAIDVEQAGRFSPSLRI